MDFMNLNQAAHGDREYGFILARLGIAHEVVAGYYKHDDFIAGVKRFAQVAKAIGLSKRTRVATFGNNMRDVAVTDGNRLECEIRYGWEIKYWGIGEIAKLADEATEAEVDAKMAEYTEKYTMATDNIEAVREQARYEIALEKFISKNKVTAFTDNFQDLFGMKQLPGIAAQNLMAKGVGFGPEGDYKISAFSSVLMKMAEGREGATGFIEDYTYDLTPGAELELASHMLEVPASFAATKPEIQVHHLGIGGKADPARLVFDGREGKGIVVSLIDMGGRMRLIVQDIECVKPIMDMPNLPVAKVMWKAMPSLETGVECWITAGGAHHTVLSLDVTAEMMRDFAKFMDIEFVHITKDTTVEALEDKLLVNDLIWKLR